MLVAALLALSASVYAATPTPTFTPTPTATPSPAAVLNPEGARMMVYPNAIYANDGVTLASAQTTPQPGAAAPWLEQSVSRTAFVLSTGSAKARFSVVLPNDYDRFLRVFAYASTTATVQALTVTLNVARNAFNGDTSVTRSAKVFTGTATDMTLSYPGLQEASTKVVRAKLPLTYSADYKAGDLLSFDLQRTGGTTTDLYIYAIELEYDYKWLRKP